MAQRKKRGRPRKKEAVETADTGGATVIEKEDAPTTLVFGVKPKDGAWWVGITDECPFASVHIGGKCFPQYSEVVHGTHTDTYRERHRGDVLELTKTEVTRILEAVQKKFVRWRGKDKSRGELLTTTSKVNKPRPDQDEPLAQYVYMVPMEAKMDPMWRASIPETLQG